jgi:glycosyltransferase involved in cell wall biosynthesis
MKRIWFVHLLNDYSGSPRVLAEVIRSAQEIGDYDPVLVTSPGQGALSDLGCFYLHVGYSWSPSKLLTLLRFLIVQVKLFWLISLKTRKDEIVYVNTLLPFGAALGAKLKGLTVIYHVHEPQVSPALLFSFLKWVCNVTADKAVFVSEYLMTQFSSLQRRGTVIYNATSSSFEDRAKASRGVKENVLMLASLKTYKGVDDFLAIAKLLPERSFELVLNCSLSDKESFLRSKEITDNVAIFEATDDVHIHYDKAKITLNLSHPDKWVESFGMTIIESFQYGAPVIVPKVGGPLELVQKTQAGFNISHENHQEIADTIDQLYGSEDLYRDYSNKALLGAAGFTNKKLKMDYQSLFLRVFRNTE